MQASKRVALTGLGVVCALGKTADELLEALRSGRGAIGPIRGLPVDRLAVAKVAAQVGDFDPTLHFADPKQASAFDRFTQLALVAAREAVAESGLSFDGPLGARTAVVLGSGVGGQETLDRAYRRFYEEGSPRVHPLTIPRCMANAPVSQITMEHGIAGPAFAVATACSSANHAIGLAFQMVRSGAVDVALAGGAEACITLGHLKAWEALRVLADDTCRPFSRDRRGMVLGEGAGVLVLESLELARIRGVPIHGELVGFGMSSDAGDLLQPSADGAARAMQAALDDAGLNREEIGYVNAHGTGTAINDVEETRALRMVFGDHAERLAVSSTKSMHGHALGAAGALELIATVLALREGFLPPTANYLGPSPGCDLDYVPNISRETETRAALSNSFAFGGLNAVLAVRAP